jgi:adenylylsulfate kinase
MSWAIWITGPPGSGKSFLARGTADALRAIGSPVCVLELDEVRQTVTPDALYSAEEREVVYRVLIAMAAELVEAGVPVIIDATGHRRAWRELARERIDRFAEVQLECPVHVCRERERYRRDSHAPPGIYVRAGRVGATVPGVDVPYEPALAPELRLRTDLVPVETMVERIVALATPWAAPMTPAAEGGVVWITGRPGTGKTTLARALDHALAARGVGSRLVSLEDLERAIQAHRLGADRGRQLAHRALGYTAKLLSEVGLLVIVDGGPSRRAWRDAARRLAPRFLEVELVCAPEVCAGRERAARWGLWPGGVTCSDTDTAEEAGGPTPDHERAPHPEVCVQTGVQSVASAVADVLRAIARYMAAPFADRLGGNAAAGPARHADDHP